MAIPSQLEEPLVEKILEDLLGEIPDEVDPGTIIPLPSPLQNGVPQDPYVAILACPRSRCGLLGLITHRQASCKEWMICGSDSCSAEYRLEGESIVYRQAQ